MTGDDPTRRQSALWGVVGGLAFLVLLQGFELATGQRVAVAVKVGVALAVGVGAAGLTHLVGRRLPAANERP